MGDSTGISWTDATWNPIRGCSRVSAGCMNCYAERVAARFSGPGQPYEGLIRVRTNKYVTTSDAPRVALWSGEVRFIAEHLADPLRWRKPRRIFVNSMSDLFHERLSNEQIAAVFGVMTACPQHTFQVLTKRARRMREWFEWLRGLVDKLACHLDDALIAAGMAQADRARIDALIGRGPRARLWPLPNVWLGVSVENQAAADERIPELLATPAAVRFLSCEPLLGEVDLARWANPACTHCGEINSPPRCDATCENCGETWDKALHWLIAGCESGPGARPCDVAWLRSLRDQCAAAGVPIFVKQAVERIAPISADGSHEDRPPFEVGAGPGSKRKAGRVIELPYLDGVQHAAFPEVR